MNDIVDLIDYYYKKYTGIKKINIWGCPEGTLQTLTGKLQIIGTITAAHAHIYGDYRGHICFAHKRFFKEDTIVAHEYAHLLADTETHDKSWQKAITELGYPHLASNNPWENATLTQNDFD